MIKKEEIEYHVLSFVTYNEGIVHYTEMYMHYDMWHFSTYMCIKYHQITLRTALNWRSAEKNYTGLQWMMTNIKLDKVHFKF